MRILSTENFKNIKALLRENYGNVHAQMELKLTPDTAAMFSRFTLQPSQSGAQWSVSLPYETSLQPFSQASELERDQISVAIRRAHTEVKKAFPTIADKIMEVPDQNAIFFCAQGAAMHVVLTQWGFGKVKTGVSTSIIRLCLERASHLSENPVLLRVVNSDGSPAAGKEFTLLIFNNEVSFTTDAAGIYNCGHIKVGTQFRVETADGTKTEGMTVKAGQDVYEVRLQMTTSLTVRVQDKEGKPVAGHITHYNGESKPTDTEGNAIYEPVPYNGSCTVTVGADGFPDVSHTLVSDPQKNIVTFVLDKEDNDGAADNIGELPPPATPTHSVRIRIVDKHGMPQANLPVKVFCQKGFEETTTDHDGWVSLKSDDLVPGEKPRVELMRPKANGKRSKQRLNQPQKPDNK